jgi:hypothetical protein
MNAVLPPDSDFEARLRLRLHQLAEHAPSTVRAPEELVVSSTGRPRRWQRRRVAGIGATVAVLAGAFGLTTMSFQGADGGGAATPEDAVRALVDALSSEDVLGALDVLEPTEGQALRGAIESIASESQRIGLLSDSLDLNRLGGLDLAFDEVTFSTEYIETGLAAVTLADGTFAATFEPVTFPLGGALRGALDASAGRIGTDLATTEPSVFAAVVERDGRWYVSPSFTAAEYARRAELPASVDAVGYRCSASCLPTSVSAPAPSVNGRPPDEIAEACRPQRSCSAATVNVGLRCEVSLKQRTIQRSPSITRCEIEALSAPTNEKPEAPDAMLIARPMTPPCTTATTTWSGWAAAMRSMPGAHPRRERIAGFGAGDEIPPALTVYLDAEGVAVDHPSAELAPLPFAQMHLAQVGFNQRIDPQSFDQRRGGLMRALHGGDVHRSDRFAGGDQAVGGAPGLFDTHRIERWVALAVDHRVGDPLDVRCGLAVAHQQDLAGAGWAREPGLPKGAWCRHEAGVVMRLVSS